MNYTLKDLSMICGLTDRTLRNYLKLGILTGEKQAGTWCFTEEHLDAFLKTTWQVPLCRQSATQQCLIF